jgi:hypothetical protein
MQALIVKGFKVKNIDKGQIFYLRKIFKNLAANVQYREKI